MITRKAVFALTLTFVSYAGVVAAVQTHKVSPIVDVQSGYLLGASQGKKWLSPKASTSQIKANRNYRLLEPKRRVGSAVDNKPKAQGAPCPDTLYVDIKPRKGVIAVGGNWNALPRVPQTLSNNSRVYRNLVADILKKRGLKPNVKITQITRVDLEGDGTQEVLLSATSHKGYVDSPNSISARSLANEYSMILLRKIIGGKVVTQMLSQEYFVKDREFNAPNIFTIVGVWDLNGDGKMEVVTRGRYYEGDWTTVYEMRGAKAVRVLEAGCGA